MRAVAPAGRDFSIEDKLLSGKKARQIVARIDAATDEAYPGRDLHIRQVALTVMRAKGLR